MNKTTDRLINHQEMQKMIYPLKLLFSLCVLGCLSFFSWPKVQAQVGNNCGDDPPLNVAANGAINVPFDVPLANDLSLVSSDIEVTSGCISGPVPSSPSIAQDRWAEFIAPTTGRYVIQYTSTEPDEDAILVLYRDSSGTCNVADANDFVILTCANDFRQIGGTETIVIDLAQGDDIKIRVMSTTMTEDMEGTLTVYQGNYLPGDTYDRPVELSVGSCDVDFPISQRYFNNEGLTQKIPEVATAAFPYAFFPTNESYKDGWVQFTAESSGIVGVEYTNFEASPDQDAAIEIYRAIQPVGNPPASSGNQLDFVGLVNNISATNRGTELIEFPVTAGEIYYVRIMNIAGTVPVSMDGGLCIFEVISRGACSNMSNIPQLSLGDCNIKVNVFGDEPFDGSNTSCFLQPTTPHDVWLFYRATANDNVRLEYRSITSGVLPSVIIYDSTSCAAITDADIITTATSTVSGDGCASNTAQNVEISFDVTAGSAYYIRIISDGGFATNGTGNETMRGNVCLFSTDFIPASDFFTEVPLYQRDGSNCGEQFNLTDELGVTSFTALSAIDNTCLPDVGIVDGWARFQTGANVNSIIVEYSNDDNDVSFPDDVAIQVYERPNITPSGAMQQPTTPALPQCDPATAVAQGYDLIDINESFTYNIPPGDSVWFAFNLNTPDALTFIANSDDTSPNQNDFSVNLINCNDIGAVIPIIGPSQISNGQGVNSTTQVGNPPPFLYYIEIDNESTTETLTGEFLISEVLQELDGCGNQLVDDGTGIGSQEGTERLILTVDQLQPNQEYLVRVTNLVGENVTGSLCVRDSSLVQGDLCTVAVPMNVGDCDVNFDLTSEFEFDQPDLDPVPCVTNKAGGTVESLNDGWIRFTAIASRTTVQYLSNGKDAAIAVYRGACGSTLLRVGCADEVGADSVETLKISTVIGLEYFIRVMNLEDDQPMTGRVCIFNTAERDVCSDNELVTQIVGDCNIPFDVPLSFNNTGSSWRDYTSGVPAPRVNEGCDTDINNPMGTPDFTASPTDESRDAWIRFIGNGNEVTLTYQNKEATSNPAIIVYTALEGPGPVDCSLGLNGAGNPLNQLACSNEANPDGLGVSAEGIQTEAVTFQTEAGRQYILRIMDIERGGTLSGMTGVLCFSDGDQQYNTCAEARPLEVGDCSVPINIIEEVNDCSGDGLANTGLNALVGDCQSGTGTFLITRNTNVTNPTPTQWRYYQQGDDPDGGATPQWFEPGFNDAGWEGPAPSRFGFDFFGGDPVPATMLDRDGNGDGTNYNEITYYFRTTITVNPANISSLELGLSADDGAIVYIDGVEVIRQNMPGGAVSPTTTTPGCIGGVSEVTFTPYTIPASVLNTALPDNAHVVAVEVHNCGNNQDLAFDMELEAVTSGTAVCTAGVEADAWATFTTPDIPASDLPDENITVQYDNRNFSLDQPANVSLAVFRFTGAGADPTDSCAVDNLELVGCTDAIVEGDKGVEEINIPGVVPNETYFVRMIKKTANKTALGKICVLWGETQASAQCPPANDYGDLDGEFKNFEVLGEWNNSNNLPSRTIPDQDFPDDYPVPCVLPGGSNPASNSPNPIRSQGWMQFTVPVGFTDENNGTGAVTVQFDNTGFAAGSNPQNAALAVYTMPLREDGAGGNCARFDSIPFSETNPERPNQDGLALINCINSVFEGSESVSIVVEEERTYFVRVMNVTAGSGTATNLIGRIRVFPFAPCDLGENLVIDGHFQNWPAIQDTGHGDLLTGGSSAGSEKSYANQGDAVGADRDYETYMDNWVHTNPLTTGANRQNFIETYPHFATDYGYVRDELNRSGFTNNVAENPYDPLFARKGELNPEGLYAVSQSPWSYKPDWFCYGKGYSGYGGVLKTAGNGNGNPTLDYCNTGDPNAVDANGEPCLEIPIENENSISFGTFGVPGATFSNVAPFEIGRPALIPVSQEANFMIVNGSFNPADNLPPGKVWCQTVDRGNSVNRVSYYIFSVWVQNMISGSRNLDVPLIRMTVCDMQDPSNVNPDNVDAYPVLGDPGTAYDSTRNEPTRLPGITAIDVSGPTGLTFHNPPVPTSYQLEQSIVEGGRQPSYGAAMPCNLPGESRDRRLKILGSSFLVTERPDRWQLIRCIYRAPAPVVKMNICLENLSLTKNGNDFGLDDIQFRECLNSDQNAEEFEKLLKGDPCELATSPASINLSLNVNMLDFTGKLIGDRVFLDWLVLNEIGTARYEVQRSTNGTDFFHIGSVDARGSTNTLENYDFVDREVPDYLPYLYYRLKIVANDGTFRYGNVVIVDLGAVQDYDLKLITNPTVQGNELEVRFNVPQGQARMTITSITGVRMMSQVVDAENGNNSIFVQTGGLAPGIYVVTLESSGKKVSKRLVVL